MPEIKHGTEEVHRYVMIVDSTDGSPELDVDVTTLDMQYTRAGAAPAAKVDATSLGAIDAAWDDNEIFQVDKLASPGLYRVDWPNAAFAAGVDSVILVVSGTGFAPAVEEITLVANRASDVATTIGAAGAGLTAVVWNSDWDTEVESEVTDSLVAHNLDHLMLTAVANNADMTVEVADGTVLSNIMTGDSDTSGYSVAADSLEAISDQAALIVADTNELQGDDIPTLIAGLNNLSSAEAEDACDAALVSINLDHLMKTAVANSADMTVEVVDGTVLSNIMTSDSDTSGYVVADDSLEAVGDRITNLNNLSAADVNAECDTALSDINLDHLLKVADADDVTDDSVIGHMTATDGDWSNFAKATDSLQAIRDRGDAAWATGAGGTGLNRLRSGTAQAGAAGTITLDAAASGTDDLYNGARVLITGATGVGQSRIITDYDGGTKIATVHRNWVTNPDLSSIFELQAADAEVGLWAGTAVTLSGTLPDVNIAATDDIDLSATQKTSVNTECDTALEDINLDHLLKVADADDVTDDSVIGHMTATDGDWSNFAKATDSLQAIRDQGDAAWTTGAGGTGLNRLRSGTAQAGAAGTITLDAAASATNDLYNGARILLTGGTGVGQSRSITDYDGGTKIATVHRNWVTNPDVTSVFEVQAADAEVGTWAGTLVTLGNGAPDVNIASTDDIDLSATQKASVNTEADNAIETYKLDHLLHTADADDVVDDSVIAKLATKGATADWSDFDNTTDSLQALRDNQGAFTVFQGTSTAASTTSKVYVQAADTPVTAADDDYNDTIIAVYDGADKTTARVNLRVVEDYDDSDPSFTVSPALAFTPGAGDYVEVYTADCGALTMLNMLASGFAGTSPNRLIDHLRSIMSKAAVTPASLGTYDPATDSLEKQSENLALATGAGFATGTDSLKEIRDAIDVLVAPSVVGSSALSGSGFLSDCVSLIRKAVDEPSANPKYTDGDVVELLQVAIDQVITDIATATDHPIIVRHSITLADGVQDYILPPQIGELLRIAKINTTTGTPEYEEYPGSYMNPAGCGWKIEGNTLRLLRDYDSTETLELMYTPNAEPLMHKGTSEAETATTITLMAIPTDGTLGTRPNEYVGMILRILSSTENIKEERVITAYDVETRIATVHKAWDTTPTGTVVYEVVPVFGRLVKHVCCLRTAIDILANEGNSQRMATLERNYIMKMSAMRRAISKKEGRFPHHFDGDTWDNTNRLGY